MRCEWCYDEISDKKNVNIAFKNNNWNNVFLWVDIYDNTHDNCYIKYETYSSIKLNKVNFEFILEQFMLYFDNGFSINTIDNWRNFINRCNTEFNLDIKFDNILWLNLDDKYKKSDIFKELYIFFNKGEKIDFTNFINIQNELYYDIKNYTFYSNKKHKYKILDKQDWWRNIDSKPKSYDKILPILFMNIVSNVDLEKLKWHIVIDKDIFDSELDKIYMDTVLSNYIVDNEKDNNSYNKYYFNEKWVKNKKLSEDLNNILSNLNIKLFSFSEYPSGIKIITK